MKNRKAQGFTLIELLNLIAIIGILAAVLIPNLLNARKSANESAAQSYLRNCVTAAEAYRSRNAALTATTLCSDASLMNGAFPGSVFSGAVIQDQNATYGNVTSYSFVTGTSGAYVAFGFNGSTVSKIAGGQTGAVAAAVGNGY